MVVCRNSGYLFAGPKSKVYNILGSPWGRLPYADDMGLSSKLPSCDPKPKTLKP